METNEKKYYTNSAGEKVDISTLETTHLINTIAKKKREIFNNTTKDDAVNAYNEIKDLNPDVIVVVAYGHLFLNGQPLGGLIGLGMSPFSTIRFLFLAAIGSAKGIADRSDLVYGCTGLLYNSSLVVISTKCPKYITPILSLICFTTDKS